MLIVDAASESALDATTAVAGLVGFVLIATIFVLGLVAGHAGVPLLDPDKIAPRHLVLLHALTTATITALAAGLVHVIDLGLEPAPKAVRWLLRGTVALYLAVELGTAAMTRAIGSAGDKRWAG